MYESKKDGQNKGNRKVYVPDKAIVQQKKTKIQPDSNDKAKLYLSNATLMLHQ